MNPTRSTGTLLREKRKAAGLTQIELAERVGVTQTAISYWETGRRRPGVDDALLLAEALNTTVERLFNRRARLVI